MPPAGGQMPITAYMSKQSSKRTRKTGSSKASQKRRSSPGRNREAEPLKKKRKQKENLTPQTSLKDVESKPDEPSSSSRPRRSPRRRRNSDTEGGTKVQEEDAGEEPVATLDETPTDMTTRKVVIEPTSSGLDDGPGLEATTTEMRTRPMTPEHRGHHRGALAANSLPSPPLTASTARRGHKSCRDEERRVEEMLEESGGVPHEEMIDTVPSPKQAETGSGPHHSNHGDDNTDGSVAPASRPGESSLVLMPPPDLPPQAASTATPRLPLPVPAQKPCSTSSDKWVPSSQTQELSIPAYHGAGHPSSDLTPRARFAGETQVVPSSQLYEMELQMPPASASATENDGSGGAHSPEVVESSQQLEAEMDATWAGTVAARQAALGWSKEADGGTRPRTPSPSPRKTESQDYDAQDEFSSQEDDSQPSSDIHASPLRMPSQMTQSSASYDSQSTASTPPQVRHFRDMFKGRDEHGNELSSQRGTASRRPLSPVPSPGDEDGYVHDPLDDISVSPPLIPEQHSSDGSSSYGSSFSETQTQPTPVRDFMAMFDSQRDEDPSQAPDVW
ncbi:hypothetical protein K466DRAFT_658858 [Polyporus arcularius HHB13444]|uniref:Uncharacterized protein n=1 Tax=Polyporus arcularius HHB13444 TaxID=1314778 RepID=A0A5C3PYK2_9APHY|nr:hypothetical protein K466DRAFT_658858 [Polyporus arcularius HHB13444]